MYTKNQNFIDAFLNTDGSIRDDRLLDAKVDVYYSDMGEDKVFTFSSRDILQSMKINENLMNGEYFSIGSACSNQITLNLLFDSLLPEITQEAKTALKSKNKIIPYIGICVDESTMEFEYIPMGVYFIYNATLSSKFKTCTITAYDQMYYLDELPSEELTSALYNVILTPDISSVLKNENNLTYQILKTIGDKYGFELDESILKIIGRSITDSSTNQPMYNTFYMSKGTIRTNGTPFPTDDCTVRQYIAYIAGGGGYNAYFNRDGKFVLRGRYFKDGTEFDKNNEQDVIDDSKETKNILNLYENDAFDIQSSLDPITFGAVNISYKIFDDETTAKAYFAWIGPLHSTTASEVKYLGVYIFPRLAQWLAEKYYGKYSESYIRQYYPTTVKWRCCPFTECGDTLILKVNGEEDIHIPVMEQEIIFAGGLQSTVKSLGESKEDTAFRQNTDEASGGIIASSGNIAGFSIQPRLLKKTFTYETGVDDSGNPITQNTTIQIGHEGGSENAKYIMTLQENKDSSYSYALHSNGDIECGNITLAPGCRINYSDPLNEDDVLYRYQADNGLLKYLTVVYLRSADGKPASISKQKNGIVLAFSRLRSDGTPDPFEINYCFIPKQALVLSTVGNTAGSYIIHTTLHMSTADFSYVGSKRIYILDGETVYGEYVTRIGGEKSNDVDINVSSGTKSGITYNNANWVLYRAYGV